jgi:hypothetical protein
MNLDNFTFSGSSAVITNELQLFKLYPNPSADGLFQLQGDMGNALMIISDMSGRIIENKLASTTENTLDIRPFGKGIYILRVQAGNKIFTQKLIYN